VIGASRQTPSRRLFQPLRGARRRVAMGGEAPECAYFIEKTLLFW